MVGLGESRLLRSNAPAFVRDGNRERMMLPCAALLDGGRRKVRALGRRLNPGQLSSVGMPQSSNICSHIRDVMKYCICTFQPINRAGRVTHLTQLIYLILPLQQRLLCDELAKYTAETP